MNIPETHTVTLGSFNKKDAEILSEIIRDGLLEMNIDTGSFSFNIKVDYIPEEKDFGSSIRRMIKAKLVDQVIKQIEEDITLEDTKPLHSFLMNLDEGLLKGFLPEKQ